MNNENLSFIWDDEEEENKNAEPITTKYVVSEVEEEEIEYYSDEPEEEIQPKSSKLLRVILIIAILIAVSLYFIPIFKVENVRSNETSFITKEKLLKSLDVKEGERYSLYKMNKLKNNLDSESVSASRSHYEFKTKSLVVEVNEIKPLAQNNAGELYYEQEGKIKVTRDMSYYVPILNGFNENEEQEIIDELKKLDYNIIKEMTIIVSAEIEERPDLVYIQMKDGNYVEIGINQINDKMKYYMQIQKIIREKRKNKPGILHLNIGDYYEPI